MEKERGKQGSTKWRRRGESREAQSGEGERKAERHKVEKERGKQGGTKWRRRGESREAHRGEGEGKAGKHNVEKEMGKRVQEKDCLTGQRDAVAA